MSKPVISIVVPIYNAQDFLSECIDSLLNQSFLDWELILVDDGSTDESVNVCRKYSHQNDKIKVVSQQNGGVTSARKLGVSHAEGEWITFVDADDTLPNDALLKMYELTNAYDTDLIIGMVDKSLPLLPKELSIDDWRESCISGRPFHVGPVAKLYRKILIEDDIFDIPRSIVKGEDMLMNIRIAFKLKTCPIVLYENVYNYRKHDTSCVHTFVPTLEYEEEYHKLRKEAILGTSCTIKHLQASVESRLEAYMFHVDVSPEDSSWNHSEFVKEIQRDAISCDYSLPIIIRILFKTDNCILRQLIVIIWRIYAYLMKIKYII